MAAVGEAPYDRSGSLVRLPEDAFEWRPNEPFHATLTLCTDSPHPASHVVWKDSQGHRFPMFASDLLRLLAYSFVSQGVTVGWWTVTKRRNRYGIRRIIVDEKAL